MSENLFNDLYNAADKASDQLMAVLRIKLVARGLDVDRVFDNYHAYIQKVEYTPRPDYAEYYLKGEAGEREFLLCELIGYQRKKGGVRFIHQIFDEKQLHFPPDQAR